MENVNTEAKNAVETAIVQNCGKTVGKRLSWAIFANTPNKVKSKKSKKKNGETTLELYHLEDSCLNVAKLIFVLLVESCVGRCDYRDEQSNWLLLDVELSRNASDRTVASSITNAEFMIVR